MPFTNPHIAAQIGNALVAEATKTGNDILITACPLCSDNLASHGERRPRSQDMSQFLVELSLLDL